MITVDADNRIAQAVAVKDGRILAVGTSAEMRQLAGPQTRTIPMHGRTILPGFIDAHAHIEGLADFQRMVPIHVPPLRGVDDILAKLGERLNSTPPEQWVVGAGGWGQPLPTRQQLDALAPHRPVVVRESAHAQTLNSRALELARIDRNTPAPVGAQIEHDPVTGEPTGRIQEMAFAWERFIPAQGRDARKASLRSVMEQYARFGVTSIGDFPSGDAIALYQGLREDHQLPLRIRLNIMSDGSPLAQAVPGFSTFVVGFGPRTGFGDPWLRLGCIKLFVDGETKAALHYDPPGQRETSAGTARYTQSQLDDLVVKAHNAGFQLCVHAVGDKAQDMALAALARALAEAPRSDARHRIEHAGINESGPTTTEQWRRMRQLGVIPVPTPAWIALAGASDDPAAASFPYRTMQGLGLRPPGSSDSLGAMPVSMNPFFGIWAMVTRQVRAGGVNVANEAITVQQALRSYTIDGAYAGLEETDKGSIEPGKLADLIIVSEDPLSILPDRLKDIRVLMTIVDGKTVWESRD